MARIPIRAFWAVLLMGTVCVLLQASGCSMFGGGEERARKDAQVLVLGDEIEDSIHCDRKQCKNWYRIVMAKPGEVIVEVDSPGDPTLPDYGVTLQSSLLEVLADDRVDHRRPRRLKKELAAGTYYLSIWSQGESRDLVSYKVGFRSATSNASTSRRDRPMQSTSPQRRPVNPTRPRYVVIESEILEVERSGGEPTSVLLDVGSANGIRRGDRGRLVERGKVICEVEISDVYSEGTRARLVGGLSAPITMSTTAELDTPADRAP